MKKLMKLTCVLLVLVLFACSAYAGQDIVTMIDAETLTGGSDTVAADRYIGDADRVTFFVTYDQDGTTVAVTASVTVAISVDGINWQDISWFDVAGGVTPVTSEILGADATYTGWLDKAITAPYIRIRVTTSGPDDSVTADATVTLVVDK